MRQGFGGASIALAIAVVLVWWFGPEGTLWVLGILSGMMTCAVVMWLVVRR